MKKIYKIGTGLMTTGAVTAAIVTPIVVINNNSKSSTYPTYSDEVTPKEFDRSAGTTPTAISQSRTNDSGTTYSSQVGPLKITSDDGLLFGFDNLDEITKWVYKNVPMGAEQKSMQSITLNHGSVFENGVINVGGHSGKKKGFNISLSPVYIMEHDRSAQTIQQLSYLFFKDDSVKSIFGLSGDDLAYRKMISVEATDKESDLNAPIKSGLVKTLKERNHFSYMFSNFFNFLLNDSMFMGGSTNKGSSRLQIFKNLKNNYKNASTDAEKKQILKDLFDKDIYEIPMGMKSTLSKSLNSNADISAFTALIDSMSPEQINGVCEAFSSDKFTELIEASFRPFDVITSFMDLDTGEYLPNSEYNLWTTDAMSNDYSDTTKANDILNYKQAEGAFKFGDTSDIKKALNMLIKQYDISNRNVSYEKRKSLLMNELTLFMTSKGALFTGTPDSMPDDIFQIDDMTDPSTPTYDLSINKILDKVGSYVDNNKDDIFSDLNGDKLLDILYGSLPFTKDRMEVLDKQSRDNTGSLQESLNNKYKDSFVILKSSDSLYRSMVRRSSYELLPTIAHEYGHHMTITHTTQAGVAIDSDTNPGAFSDKVMSSVETVSTAEEADLVDTDKYKLFQSLFPQELKDVIDKTSDADDQTDIIDNIARALIQPKGYFKEMATEVLNGAGGQAYYNGNPSTNPAAITLIYAAGNGKTIPSTTSLLDFYNTVSESDWVDNNGMQSFSKFFPAVKDASEIKPVYKETFKMYQDMMKSYGTTPPKRISSQLINGYLATIVHDNTHTMMEAFNKAITKNGKSLRDSDTSKFANRLIELLEASFDGNDHTTGVLSCFDKTTGKLKLDDVVAQAKQYVKDNLPGYTLSDTQLKTDLGKIWTTTIDGKAVDDAPFSVPTSFIDPVVTKFLINSKTDYEYIGRTITATPMYGTDSTSMARYTFTYYESLTRIWQLLTLPYNRELQISTITGTNADLARFAQFGLRFYDDNGKINALGKAFVKMYAEFFDLDKDVSLINRSPNDGKFTFSGHFDKSKHYKGLLFMQDGKVAHEEDITIDVENIKYNTEEGDASTAEKLTDRTSWMTKNMVIGDFKNADLTKGDYVLAFWDDKDNDGIVDSTEIIYIKNKDTSENGEMNNNGYIDTNAAVEGNPEHKDGNDNFKIKVHGVLV